MVIGGGIHGAGIAQAAAAGGFSVLVLEQHGLASGTSSRSSKLIHGGLRYLESGQMALVRECLHERELLLKLAPGLVHLQPFYIPIYSNTMRRPAQLRVGLSLYALLGGMDKAARFRRVPGSEWGSLDGLETRDLEAVFQYWDGQTDDAALTRAVMRSAQDLGAHLQMPANFTGAHLDAEGCRVAYQYNGQNHTCQATVLVNAAGPWVNQVLDRIAPAPAQLDVELVQGTHLVVAGTITRGIYYVEAPQDQRAVFVMPWQGNTLVGTTETLYQGDPAAVQPLPQEQEYLMQTLAHYFPAYRHSPVVLSAFAGLRVLPGRSRHPEPLASLSRAVHGGTSVARGRMPEAADTSASMHVMGESKAFSHPRDTVLHVDRQERPRLLTIYGGKLTAYRSTAERVMQRLATTLPSRTTRADTRTLILPV